MDTLGLILMLGLLMCDGVGCTAPRPHAAGATSPKCTRSRTFNDLPDSMELRRVVMGQLMRASRHGVEAKEMEGEDVTPEEIEIRRLCKEYRDTNVTSPLQQLELSFLTGVHDAWGILLKKRKRFWFGRPSKALLKWLEDNFPDDKFAQCVLGKGGQGNLPGVFSATGGLRVPTLRQWKDLWREYRVPNHMHIFYPGDVYVIRRDTFHLVINEDGLTVSFAGDAHLFYFRDVFS
jgi:hypothetical protein